MSISLFDLTGKTALVTGGSQGIGAALSRGLGMAGATIIVNGRTQDKLSSFVEDLQRQHIKAEQALFDICDPEAIKTTLRQIEQSIGPIDILVNNAGIIRRAPAEQLEDKDWNDVIATNLTAPFVLCREVGKTMISRRRGKIINICSLMSELGRETVTAYAAAKGGLKMLTRNLATEWAAYNIQVNGIGPGYIATPINENYREKGNPLNDYIISRTPAGRWGTPQDLVGAAIFLASEASDFVNGQILYVDGGLLTTFGKPYSTE